ncbi:nuclear transport factor 2 family protein [Psychroserpens damuponensis]|uniref:nuclear transport factor 2 family protein n=1 Tax=Psychroserpens damuponensis TaxID=943936 RepID=UPI0005915432|nr:nuclear transport factor 2 family protein [Psychroserpens damuponensis]
MRNYLILFCLLSLPITINSQTNPEIFLFDVTTVNSKIEIENPRNLSNNNGYDNQPSFYDSHTILFAATRNNQTDIATYNLNDNSISFINETEGGEYTPLKFPKKKDISAVRLDNDGKQRLYRYNLENGASTELIKDLVVAYYTWFNEEIIVSAVIEGDQLNLYRTNLNTGNSKKLASNVGRSFHRIPNSDLVSFISKENEKQWQIKSLNPVSGQIRLIANTIANVEDICWLNKKNLLSSDGSTLYKLTMRVDNNWKKVKDLYQEGIIKISRLATNSDGTKLLVTGDIKTVPKVKEEIIDPNQPISEEDASQIVDRRIEPYNTKQLANFVNAFNDDVTVHFFPDDKLYEGKTKLEETYNTIFKEHDKLNIKVLNRIHFKNYVIDEELALINNITRRQATIYEIDRNGINAMTFLSTSTVTENPETVVNNQLAKYNERDIKAFANTFSKNVKLYSFPNNVTTDGRSALKKSYDAFFKNTPDLNVEIVNRIILGNMVIDKEKVTINGQIVYAIAIYEIEKGLITTVTFMQ